MDVNNRRLAAAPLQFGLRAMFGLVAAISLWLAAGLWFGPIGPFFSAVAVLAVAFLFSGLSRTEKALGLLLAVLALLLLIPLATASKGTITRSDCRNNLRQIGLALQQYHVTINSAGGKGISSQHPGGANVVMADGLVRSLPDSMSWTALHALLTRNGGETPAKP